MVCSDLEVGVAEGEGVSVVTSSVERSCGDYGVYCLFFACLSVLLIRLVILKLSCRTCLCSGGYLLPRNCLCLWVRSVLWVLLAMQSLSLWCPLIRVLLVSLRQVPEIATGPSRNLVDIRCIDGNVLLGPSVLLRTTVMICLCSRWQTGARLP